MKSCDYLFTTFINRYSKKNAEDILLSDLWNRKSVKKTTAANAFLKKEILRIPPMEYDILIFNLITLLLRFNH